MVHHAPEFGLKIDEHLLEIDSRDFVWANHDSKVRVALRCDLIIHGSPRLSIDNSAEAAWSDISTGGDVCGQHHLMRPLPTRIDRT